MSAAPIFPITAMPLREPVAALPAALPSPQATGQGSFANLLTDGIDGVSTKLQDADKLAHAFALDDSIPVHQVTYALEQARLSLELMTQVRSRLIEGYQQLMNMQL